MDLWRSDLERAEPIAALNDASPDGATVPLALPLDDTPAVPAAIPVLAEAADAVSPAPPLAQPAALDERTVRVLVPPTSTRRLIECLIVFVSTILFLRAMAVEPFGVPTGSMAPTLIGNHKLLKCPHCGYPVRVGEPSRQPSHYPSVTCPNCGQRNIDMNQGVEVSGDRLLVDKNVYSLRKPRRWEPAVFRCPSDLSKPYVKRVAALPGERVLIRDGDVYVNDHIARKTIAECREARVPVFDIDFPPNPNGWSKHWSLEQHGNGSAGGEKSGDGSLVVGERELRLDASQAGKAQAWADYRHRRDEREEVIRDSFVYNGQSGEDRTTSVHDFFVEFEVEIVGGAGSFLCRMFDGKDQLIAAIPVGAGDKREEMQLKHEGMGIVRTAQRHSLRQGKKYRVEMAFVDRRISLAIDGSEPFRAFDLEPAHGRADVISPVALGAAGVSAVVRQVKLYRDIYYRSSGKNAVDQPLQLGQDEYFMLGDNSGNSDDSRSWPIPGVPERNFLGKPFLLHQPSKVTHLTIGGRERYFQTIDWSRIRFLR